MVEKHNLNNYEFYMNLPRKTPNNVRISFKGTFPIKTSKVLLAFHILICPRLIGLVESFDSKNK